MVPVRRRLQSADMRRRTFLVGSLATVGATAGGLFAMQRAGPDGGSSSSRVYGATQLRRRKAASDAPNVLFITLDDCNDWLGFLNDHPGTRTPNLDALAATSLSFHHAYCAAPMCLPARTSLLFGRHPHVTGVYDHSDASRANYERLTKETPSIVDDLWAAGYDTYGAGKVFHDEQKERWTEFRRFPWYSPGHRRKQLDAHTSRYDPDWVSPYDGQPIGGGENFDYTMLDFGPSGRAAEDEADGKATAWVLERLARNHRRPFFIALGLYLPHEPWRLPQRYFDLHPLDEVVVPEVPEDDLDDLPPFARERIIDRFNRFETIRENGLWERVVQAYQAAITYADDHAGRVLDALASGPHAEDTVVVVTSDHGYHLGEKMHIEKFTLWERATRIPLLLHVPGRYDDGRVFEAPVSVVDVAPTLAELCGARVHAEHDGASLIDLVEHPERADDRPPIMTWLEGNHSVRRGSWRYIRYRTGEAELYDHRRDPHELTNLVSDPAHASTVAELDALLPST